MKLLSILILSVISFASMAQQSQYAKIAGDWEGTLAAQGQEFKVIFHIKFEDGKLSATLDSPDQNATGLKVDEVSFVDGVLKMKSNQVQGTYEGTVINNMKTEGKWAQGGMSFDLNLVKKVVKAKS